MYLAKVRPAVEVAESGLWEARGRLLRLEPLDASGEPAGPSVLEIEEWRDVLAHLERLEDAA